jgi:hypothetical protein
MYGGHLGIALAGKGFRSTIPMWLLVLATQLPDWADAAVCSVGTAGTSEMWSHSLPAVGVLAVLLALSYIAWSRDTSSAAIVGVIVVSHAVVDYATGLKPTWPGGPHIGLQLYRRPAIDFLVEGIVILVGWMIYRRSLPEERRRSSPVTLLLVSLVLLQLAASVSFFLFPGIKKC